MSRVAVLDNYMSEVCANNILRNAISVGGPSLTVEIDNSLFSKRKCIMADASFLSNGFLERFAERLANDFEWQLQIEEVKH